MGKMDFSFFSRENGFFLLKFGFGHFTLVLSGDLNASILLVWMVIYVIGLASKIYCRNCFVQRCCEFFNFELFVGVKIAEGKN